MRKLSILSLIAMVAISCQSDFNEVANTAIEPNENSNPYAVSVEQALDRLYTELADIYGEGTRAASRAVKSVKTINAEDIAPATRSSENIDASELLYIVEFEDNQGSAILGADVRVDEVFAILDEDVISAEDFERAVSGEDDGEIDTYLAGLIADEAMDMLSGSITILPPIDHDRLVSYFEYVTVAQETSEHHMRTKWGQNSPYNSLCYNENGVLCVAGCVTIAAAQLLLYNAEDEAEYLTINGDSFDIETLRLKSHNVELTDIQANYVNNEVARYVYKLAEELDITLGPNTSTGSINNITYLMNQLGYRGVFTYNSSSAEDMLDEVRTQLYVEHLPTVMRGEHLNATTGHAWVIDGYNYKKQDVYFCTRQGLSVISREYVRQTESTKVHCNFGWTGKCDGYYTFGIFDVSTERSSENVITDIGDRVGTNGNSVYDTDLKIIRYSL